MTDRESSLSEIAIWALRKCGYPQFHIQTLFEFLQSYKLRLHCANSYQYYQDVRSEIRQTTMVDVLTNPWSLIQGSPFVSFGEKLNPSLSQCLSCHPQHHEDLRTCLGTSQGTLGRPQATGPAPYPLLVASQLCCRMLYRLTSGLMRLHASNPPCNLLSQFEGFHLKVHFLSQASLGSKCPGDV